MAAGDVHPHADALRAAAPLPGPSTPGDLALTPVATERIATGFYLRYGKRLFDVVGATVLLLLALPLVAAVVIVVFVTSGWPVLHRSSRQGLDGRAFRMWKFRTMVRDAERLSARWPETDPELALEMQATWKLKRDPRITRVGSFLRRSSLDELPQLVNVLRGEMSLVGPRPYLTRETLDPLLAPSINAVRPGITGPFQTRGRNGLMPIQRQKLEASYWRDVSLTNDLRYLALTVRPLLRMDGQ